MSNAIPDCRFFRRGVAITFTALTLMTAHAYAQAEATSESLPVGSSPASDPSDSLAATVDVPVSSSSGQPLQYLTEVPPSPQPAEAAERAAQAVPNGSATAPGQATASANGDADPNALEVFRAELDPYGRWMDDADYGRVWVPSPSYVGSSFVPYVSNGQWGLDANNNWVWMSDYAFGDVVFHYGRWVQIDGVGWSWIAGSSYAPAWVVWRVPIDDYAYVGWAPAPPTYGWYGGSTFWLVNNRPLPFVFCPSRYVFYPHFGSQLVRDRYIAANLVHHTVWHSTAPLYGRSATSPALARARVPSGAVPAQRVPSTPRALPTTRFGATPSAMGHGAAANRSPYNAPSQRFTQGHSTGFGTRSNNRSSIVGYGPVAAQPLAIAGSAVGRGSGGFSSQSQPFSGLPSARVYGRQIQSLGTSPGIPLGRPSYFASNQSNASPRYSTPDSSYSTSSSALPSRAFSSPNRDIHLAPSFSHPGHSFSPPSQSFHSAPSFSAPSHSFSSPSQSFHSAPSFSGAGGGFRGGSGGGFRSGGGGGRRR